MRIFLKKIVLLSCCIIFSEKSISYWGFNEEKDQMTDENLISLYDTVDNNKTKYVFVFTCSQKNTIELNVTTYNLDNSGKIINGLFLTDDTKTVKMRLNNFIISSLIKKNSFNNKASFYIPQYFNSIEDHKYETYDFYLNYKKYNYIIYYFFDHKMVPELVNFNKVKPILDNLNLYESILNSETIKVSEIFPEEVIDLDPKSGRKEIDKFITKCDSNFLDLKNATDVIYNKINTDKSSIESTEIKTTKNNATDAHENSVTDTPKNNSTDAHENQNKQLITTGDQKYSLIYEMINVSIKNENSNYETQLKELKNKNFKDKSVSDSTNLAARKLNDEGLIYLRQNQLQDAIKSFKESNSLNNKDVEVLNNLGYALLMNGDLKSAEIALLDALILSPERKNAWSNLGDVYSGNNDKTRAIACYKNVIIFSKDREKTSKTMQKIVDSNKDLPSSKNREIAIAWASNVF